MQYKKHFKLEEARELLHYLQPRLRRIRQLSLKLNEVGFDIYRGQYKPGFHPDTLDEYPIDYYELTSLIGDINDKGIELRGLENGLVDFPALRENGEEVFLCWKVDEEDIEFWHSLDGGYIGRKHISEF